MLFKIGALKNFANHTAKTAGLEPPFNKTISPQAREYRETSNNIPFYRTAMMVTSGEDFRYSMAKPGQLPRRDKSQTQIKLK